jgi:mannose-6-phosphate isomerase
MKITDPILFEPLAMERVWGGHRFATLLGKALPPGVLIGELWEMVDRPEAQSVVHDGPLKGMTLHDLWTHHRGEVFGEAHLSNSSPRFPLLIKLLDARERLSVQVHPPASVAAKLGGEPKTECWYFLHAASGASIYAGLKWGVTREAFETALGNGTVEETLHRVPSRKGEGIFIPSGRLHAIGEGLVIVEVQQNSDTTYRVFDWNRNGLDGKPRKLHLEESLASIDFDDFEPVLAPASARIIADCVHFLVEKFDLPVPRLIARQDDFSIIACVDGMLKCKEITLNPGGFMLIPSSMRASTLVPQTRNTSYLQITLPHREKVEANRDSLGQND